MSAPRSRPTAETVLAAVILAAAVVLAFGPILGNGFVNWDDDVFLLRNESWRGLDWPHLRWMFSSFSLGAYQPLPWMVFALIFKLQGLQPAGYHLASLVFHAANAFVFYRILMRLFPGARSAALSAALLWAVHPVQVQLVAWATPLSDLMATLFFLMSVLAYLHGAVKPRRVAWMALSVACFAASGLCRWKGYALPLALVVLDFEPLGRLNAKNWRGQTGVWLEKLPYLAVSAAMLWVNAASKSATPGQFHFAPRPEEACAAALFYIAKLLAPFGLIPLYAFEGSVNPLGWSGAWCAAAFAALTAGLAYFARRRPALIGAWLFFAASIIPPLVFTPPGPVFASLAHVYLAGLGLAALACALMRDRPAARAAVLVLVCACIVLSRAQSRRWRDSISLWTHTLAVDPDAYVARDNLGAALLDGGRAPEAAVLFRQQLARHPEDDMARSNLATALAVQAGVRPVPSR